MAKNLRAELQGFRKNCLDSLAHALAHYGELSFEGGRFHDRKWAVLSVAHAAEIYCNLLLTVLDPRHPCGGRYPSLSAAVQHLQETYGVRAAISWRNARRSRRASIFDETTEQADA